LEHAEYALMDAAEEAMWWYRALHLRLLRAMEGVQGSVLDAGCGTGGFLQRLGAARPELALFGVDFASQAAARAAAKSGAATAAGSVTALPFADASFDAVVSADVLCHRSVDPAVALAEFARVLRPGGRLVLNLPAYDWLMSAHDRRVHTARRSTAGGLRRLLKAAGYVDVRTRYWNALLLPLMVLERKLVARGAGAVSDVKPFHPVLDAAFFAATEVERRLPFPMPAGGSVMAVAQTSLALRPKTQHP
jgi:SAM-dependent methyltransferase